MHKTRPIKGRALMEEAFDGGSAWEVHRLSLACVGLLILCLGLAIPERDGIVPGLLLFFFDQLF